MEVPSESFKGELGIEEPVILCEPRILTVNQWLVDYIQNMHPRNGNPCYTLIRRRLMMYERKRKG
jgi:hypothetical protein